MRDIDSELSDIIIDHELDNVYPKFKAVIASKQAIYDLSNSWLAEERIACLTLGEDKRKTIIDEIQFRESIISYKEKQVDFFSIIRKDFTLEDDDTRAYDYKELDGVDWSSYDYVYIISNYGSHILDYYLDLKNKKHICLYDWLSERGIHDFNGCREEYYEIVSHRIYVTDGAKKRAALNPIEFEANRLLSKLNKGGEGTYKVILLKRLFFCALLLRNFLLAKETAERIIGSSYVENRYRYAWEAVQSLLLKIKHDMAVKNNDVANIWIDARNYHEDLEQKCLSSLKYNSIYFSNMVTFTGYTHETLRTMFLSKRLLDDDTMSIQKIDEDNSPVLRLLKSKGYQIKILGNSLSNVFEDEQRGKVGPYIVPASMVLWETIKQSLIVDNPVFSVAHVFMETHPPHWTVSLLDKQVYGFRSIREVTGNTECDRQVEFYIKFFKKQTAILFNDHGVDGWWPRQHIMFAIVGDKYSPRQIHGLCSNIDYHKIIEMLIEKGDIEERALIRKFVEIQGTNVRSRGIDRNNNPGFILQANPNFQWVFKGYTGIVTDKYVYVYMGNREFLQERGKIFNPHWFKCPEDICDEKLLPLFRKMARTENGMPMKMTETKAFLNMCKVYDNAWERNQNKLILANEFMSSIKGSIALYDGNWITKEFYFMLNEENRKKICCIIDYPVCACEELNLQLMTLREFLMSQDKGKWADYMVLPPSLNDAKRRKLEKEYNNVKDDLSKDLSVEVLDMNMYLKQHGVEYNSDFGSYEIRLEDFDGIEA